MFIWKVNINCIINISKEIYDANIDNCGWSLKHQEWTIVSIILCGKVHMDLQCMTSVFNSVN
jgi:hypothetical protein